MCKTQAKHKKGRTFLHLNYDFDKHMLILITSSQSSNNGVKENVGG